MAADEIINPAALLKPVLLAILASTSLYAAFIGLLTIPRLQSQVIYLNSITLARGQDPNVPEQFGFLRNQVSSFTLKTPDGEALHAWHVLPLGAYMRHEKELAAEPPADVSARLSFTLLRDDPDALLVLCLHGAAGTLASGHRPQSYRALSAGAPERIHVVAVDYRGFGTSTGRPSEDGLLIDAVALVEWAMREAGIPAERIVVWGQSLGTAVATALVHDMVHRREPVVFAGLVMVAPFADVKSLTATYRVGGMVPLLGPVARFPRLLDFLNSFIRDRWQSDVKLAGFVRGCEDMDVGGRKYFVSIIHAEDDFDIPWTHSDRMFWTAVNASIPAGVRFEDLEQEKEVTKVVLGDGGWGVTRRTERGEIREDIMKYGLHDKIMGYPVVSMAVMRAFGLGG